MGRLRGNKRKKSKSPVAAKNSMPKKVKPDVPLQHQAAVTNQSLPKTSSSSNVQVSVSGKAVKPVFANTNIKVIKNVLSSVKFNSIPLCKVRGSNSTQILCGNIDDKKMLINKLQIQQIGFHTFTDSADKPTYFLLRGFYDATCDETLAALKASGVPALKVTDFIRKDNYVLFLVHFDNSVNINMLNYSHKHVDGIVVKWEIVKKSNKKVTQCFRCQKWGHASINCGLPARCVKCSDSHDPGACTRTSRDGDPKCCNCGGPHTSNHRGCPAYSEHMEKLRIRSKKKPSSSSSAPVQRTQVPVDIDVQFPRLHSQEVPASVPSGSSNTNGNRAIFVEAHIHAREWIASATTTWIINELLRSTNADVQDLAENIDWYFLTNANPDGYEYTRTSNRNWRKTRSQQSILCWGVDPNRNFGYNWMVPDEVGSTGSSTSPCSDVFSGPEAFSEPECHAIDKFLNSHKGIFDVYLAMHSYDHSILFPYGNSKAHVPNHDELLEVGNAAAEMLKLKHGISYRVGNQAEILYAASGNSQDNAYGQYGIPLSYTYEMRGSGDYGNYGFFLPPEFIIPNSEEVLESFIGLVRKAREFGKL